MTRRLALAPLLLALLAAGPAAAQENDYDFKKLMERGEYEALGRKLRAHLDLEHADPKLRRYLELNLEFLARGAKPKVAGSELILVRGAKNDQVFKMPAASGGASLMLPNSIRYMRAKWDARLPRIDRYFREATTLTGGNGDSQRELDRIIEHHKGGGLGKNANSVKSVLISASTQPLANFGPPYYLLKVAPERAIFNHKGLTGEYEVLLPFWILPTEIVGKFDSMEELKRHPLYEQSKLKDLQVRSGGYGAAGAGNNWAVIEDNIRNGRPPLEGIAGLNSYFPGGADVGPRASEEYLRRFAEKVARHGGTIERVAPGDLRLPEGAQARTILGADGRPKVLVRADRPTSKLALLDELTHVLQLERMIRARGAAETGSILLRARSGDPVARDVVNRWELRAKRLTRGMLASSDPLRGELDKSIRMLEKELDPYGGARRRDGTIDWKRAARQLGGGVAHFTLALFLKELAVVARTGDALRIEEFFDGLLTTDFYVHYGLFSLGAAGADLAYARFLERSVARFVRPKFVQSVLRSNVSLAVGMALPEILSGQFSGRAFAINLAGLGLSSTAVKAGVEALKWVFDAKRIPGGGKLVANLARAKRLASVGAWVYTAAETAVVLYFGDAIAREIDEALERRQAREELEAAAAAVLADPTGDGARERLDALAAAHRRWRDVLARPIHEAEQELWTRLGKLGLDVKRSDDGLRRLKDLAERNPGAYGAVAERAKRLAEAREQEFSSDIERIVAAYERRVAAAKDEVYGDGAADTSRVGPAVDALLRGDEATTWAFAARLRRGRHLGALSDLPDTRLGAYAHEAALYDAVAARLAPDDPEAAAEYEARGAFTRDLAQREREIVLGSGQTGSRAEEAELDATAKGFLDALERVGDDDDAGSGSD